MPEHNSNPSSGDTGTGVNTINSASTAPFIKDMIHRLFIPTVLLIVSGIVFTATFNAGDLSRPTASLPKDQGNELASSDDEKAVALVDVDDEPADSVETQAVHKTAATETVPAVTGHSPSVIRHGLYTGHGFGRAYPSGRPAPYTRSEIYPPVYSEVLAQRRMAYQKAAQAREQHWKQIRANRAAVLKRIEQNRENMYRRMQEIEQQKLKRTNQRLNRLEQNGKLAGYYPI